MSRPEHDEWAAGAKLAAHPALEPNGSCSRCNAPVRWVKTTRGRNLPLDLAPSTSPLKGNFGLGHDEIAHFVRDAARMRAFNPEGTRSEFPIFECHFATCAARKRST